MTIELKNSKLTRLPDAPDGRRKFALDCSIGAVQMREPGGEWQDINPKLVRDAEGWHAGGTPYALKILDDGTRTIHPDKTDLGKYIHLPTPAVLQGLSSRVEGNKLIFYTSMFEVIYQLTNTGVQLMVLMKAPVLFDRIALNTEAVGLDIDKLLGAKTGLGIPRPRLIDAEGIERWLDWSYEAGQLELGFDVSGLKFPILLKNTTVEKQIAAGVDDGQQKTGTDGFNNNSTVMGIGYAPFADEYHMHMFARWIDVTLSGTIDVSHIQLFSNYQTGVPLMKVYGIDEDNPAAPTTSAEFDADPLTTAAVDWDGALNDEAWNESPSLNAIFQELVDSHTISGDSVMVQVKNDGGTYGNGGARNTVRTRDWGAALSPKLHVEYSELVEVIGPFPTHFVIR